MKSIHRMRSTQAGDDGGHSLFAGLRPHRGNLSEIFWFSLTFILFLIMGPFSAIAVLIGIGSLASEEHRSKMTEPASL